MTRRSSSHAKSVLARRVELHADPGRKPASVSAQPLGARECCEDCGHARQKGTAAVIQVVEVVVVRKQHRVDRVEGVRRHGRTARLSQRGERCAVLSAGRIKRGIGEKPKAGDFEQGGGPADVGGAKRECRHVETSCRVQWLACNSVKP